MLSKAPGIVLERKPLPDLGAAARLEQLASTGPFAMPLPLFETPHIWQETSEQYLTALKNNRPFFIDLGDANLQAWATARSAPGEAGSLLSAYRSFPLAGERKVCVFAPLDYFEAEVKRMVGEVDFLKPFLNVVLANREKIGVRRNPPGLNVSDIEAHYLVMALAGMQYAKRNWPLMPPLPPSASIHDPRPAQIRYDHIRYNGTLWLAHDLPEDNVLTLAQTQELASPYTNGYLSEDVATLTREKLPGNIPAEQREANYREYGMRIASSPTAYNLIPGKRMDTFFSTVQDELCGTAPSDDYIRKQAIIYSSMAARQIRLNGVLRGQIRN